MEKTFKLEIKNYLERYNEIQEIENFQARIYEKEWFVNSILGDMMKIDTYSINSSDKASDCIFILECLKSEKDIIWSIDTDDYEAQSSLLINRN